jgi:uncharacterized protein YjbI with pentapeptide repeats
VSLWVLLIVGVALAVVLLGVGAHMIRPSWSEQGTRADVGVAVVTTTVLSLAIFVLQVLDENRLQREDVKRQDEAANQALRLQLGLSKTLKNMDLKGQDLSGINLPGKHLDSAHFDGADLSDANLAGAFLPSTHFPRADLEGANLGLSHLGRADLSHADLDRAFLEAADLELAHLDYATLKNADLGYANLYHAYAYRADFSGATGSPQADGMYYNSNTVFPNGKTLSCKSAQCTLTQKQWEAEQKKQG